jgi:hypothetical protein
VTAATPAPSVDELRAALAGPGALGPVDRSADALRAATAPAIDLSQPSHRAALHQWLNAWGCRIRYPRPGEPDRFDVGLAEWWSRRGRRLRRIDEPLADLTDRDIGAVADAYDDLRGVPVATDARGHDRTVGPTAAAKCLYALRPRSVMPWDLMIAERLHGGRDRDAFARHLALGRAWARSLLAQSGLDEPALVAELGRPDASLARVLDEYCWLRWTFAS